MLPALSQFSSLALSLAAQGQVKPPPSAPAAPPVPSLAATALKKDSGKESFRQGVERQRYRIHFSINGTEALRTVLARFHAESDSENGGRRFAVISGGGVVGYAAAIRLRQRYGYNVIIVEKRELAEREQVLDLKGATLREFPPELIEQLAAGKYITRCACRVTSTGKRTRVRMPAMAESILADLGNPQPERHPQLLARALASPTGTIDAPWRYPPEQQDADDFYDTFALAQTRDLQIGMNRYCLDIGIEIAHGEVAELLHEGDEYRPGIRLHGASHSTEPIFPPPDLQALVVIAEGKTPRLDASFGGTERIEVNEVWHQRNFKAERTSSVFTRGGGSAVVLDHDQGAAVVTQVWDGADGVQANVSVLIARNRPQAADDEPAQPALERLFGAAQSILDAHKLPIKIDYAHETFRSPPIPIVLTRARNPVHDNVVFIGDSSGLSSPFNSRSANDGVIGLVRILEEYVNDPDYLSNDAGQRLQAQNRARQKYNAVYGVRHGTALDVMLEFDFYTRDQLRQIRASFEKDRRMAA